MKQIALLRSRGSALWTAVAILESLCAAFPMARIAFGPITMSPHTLLWLFGAAAWFALYLGISLWSTRSTLVESADKGIEISSRLWAATLPFLAAFLILTLLLVRFDLSNRISPYISTIQPFPTLAAASGLLLVWLLKLLIADLRRLEDYVARHDAMSSAANVAIPTAFLLIGVLQASVYLFPIGNAFLRFWAIADAIGSGLHYPVTLTESASIAAGSPPFVYDLPLFPLLMKGAFILFGHNSTAAHMPAAVADALFPLSLYLLIARATRSRVTAVLFSALTSLFPYFRFWVLNLPDPDPFLLTSACFAAYLYLRALDSPRSATIWTIAGLAGGILSLARPEGILYAGCLGLGLLISRPKIKQFGLYTLSLAIFLVPTIAMWVLNFGFLWPQNYNDTLGLDYPARNYAILRDTGALGFYQRGLDVSPQLALGLLLLFVACILCGMIAMLAKDRRLLAFAVPGLGNTVMIFFANPAIPNTLQFADFFRHDSFGIPFLMATSAFGLHLAWRRLASRPRLKIIGQICFVLLIAAVIREGDKLANPTATHRPGMGQVLLTYPYLSMETIFEHPFTLPNMTYYRDGNVTVAKPTSIAWPDDAVAFFKPLDMAFDSRARPFGYTSVIVFLIALGFAMGSENSPKETGDELSVSAY